MPKIKEPIHSQMWFSLKCQIYREWGGNSTAPQENKKTQPHWEAAQMIVDTDLRDAKKVTDMLLWPFVTLELIEVGYVWAVLK